MLTRGRIITQTLLLCLGSPGHTVSWAGPDPAPAFSQPRAWLGSVSVLMMGPVLSQVPMIFAPWMKEPQCSRPQAYLTPPQSCLFVQLLVMSDFLWPHGLQHARILSFVNSCNLLKLMSNESVMSSNHLILCCTLLLPSIFPSIRVFSNEAALCIRWPKYWSFSFSISLSNEYSELISIRSDWFDLLSVQGTLKSLFQFQSIDSLVFSLLYGPNSHIHTWLLEKP